MPDREFSAAAMDALPNPAHRRNRMKFVPRYGTFITDGQIMTSRDGTRVCLAFDPQRISPAALIGRITSRHAVRDLFVENPPIETIIAAVVLIVLSWAIFIVGLGITVPVWPEW